MDRIELFIHEVWRMSNRWISIEERFPPSGYRYFVKDAYGNISIARYEANPTFWGWKFDDGTEYYHFRNGYPVGSDYYERYSIDGREPVAWLIIPPPK